MEVSRSWTPAANLAQIGRINIAACSLGGAQAAFEQTLEYVKDREQFGHAVGDNQVHNPTLNDELTSSGDSISPRRNGYKLDNITIGRAHGSA